MGCRARLSEGVRVEAARCDELMVKSTSRRLLAVPKRVSNLKSDGVALIKRVVQLGGDGLNTCGSVSIGSGRADRAMTASSRSSHDCDFNIHVQSQIDIPTVFPKI
jgi:hypothetical protein